MKKYHGKSKAKKRSSISSQAAAIDENSKQIEKTIKKMAPSSQMDMRSVKVLVERTKFNVMHLEVNKKSNATKAVLVNGDDGGAGAAGVGNVGHSGSGVVVEIKSKSPAQGRRNAKNKTLPPVTPSPLKQNQKQKLAKQTTLDKVFRARKCYVKIPKDKTLIRLQMSQPSKEQIKPNSTSPPVPVANQDKPISSPPSEEGQGNLSASTSISINPKKTRGRPKKIANSSVDVPPVVAQQTTATPTVAAAAAVAAVDSPPTAATLKRKSTEASGSSPPKRKSKKGNEFFISITSLARMPSPRRRAVGNSSSDELSPPKSRKGKKYLKKADIMALRKKFGSRFFKSYVKIKRVSDTSHLTPDPPPSLLISPKKKNRKNLSVSFLDTVEIFGESSEGEDWPEFDTKSSSRSKRLENGTVDGDFLTDFSTSTPCGGTGGGGNGSGDASNLFKSAGILKRKEKISFSPLKEDEISPRKEQLKRANEVIVRRSLELEQADEEERERDMTEDTTNKPSNCISNKRSNFLMRASLLESVLGSTLTDSFKSTLDSELKKEFSTTPEIGIVEDERHNSPQPLSPPNDCKTNSNVCSLPLPTLADEVDADIEKNQQQQQQSEDNSANITENEETPAENTKNVDEEESPTTDSKNQENADDDEEEEEESFQSAVEASLPCLTESDKVDECAEELNRGEEEKEEESNEVRGEPSERLLEADNEEEQPESTEDISNKPAEVEAELPSNESRESEQPDEEEISKEDNTQVEGNIEEAEAAEEEEEEDEQEEEEQQEQEQEEEAESDANAEIDEQEEVAEEEDEDDTQNIVDTTKFVATVLLQDSTEEERNEADALLNDVCQIAEAESVAQLNVENNLTADVDFSSTPIVNDVDDDDFNSVLTHPEIEKTLQAAASTSLVPNSQEIVVADAVVSQAAMVAPSDVEVTEDTFASVVAEVERFTKEVNPEIYSAEVGITGNDVMMDNVQARHSLDDIFDDDVEGQSHMFLQFPDDIISSLRMSSGSIDIGHDKSLPIQVIETEVMAIPNEPDLIFDKPLGTAASILGNTQISSTNDSLVGHGHSSTPDTNTKIFGRIFQSVKSYVMPGGDKSSALQD